MKANAEQINHLLLHSSSVEELEKNSPLKIRYGPHYIFVDTVTLKVILCSEVYGRTTAALYNSKENIIFFANEVHMKQCLRQWGLAEDTLSEYLVELIIEEKSEEVIPTIIVSHPLIQLVMLYTFIAIINWRLRKTKFPF